MHHSRRPKQLWLLALTLICLITFQPAAYSQETKKPLTNADVVKLLENGFGDEQIIRTIEASPSQFDISADALIELKKAGVSQTVISAILKAATPKTTPVASESPAAPLTSTPPAQPYVLIFSTTTKPVLSANVPTCQQSHRM